MENLNKILKYRGLGEEMSIFDLVRVNGILGVKKDVLVFLNNKDIRFFDRKKKLPPGNAGELKILFVTPKGVEEKKGKGKKTSQIQGNETGESKSNHVLASVEPSPDQAQLTQELVREEKNPGGIDLTRKRLNLQTQGEGIEFNLPFDPNNLEKIPINGLTPVIFQITPVTDLPLLLGLAEEHPETLSAVR